MCRSINKNKNTHSSKDKSKGSYKSRDSLQTLRRTYHERHAELAQGEVWVEEVWLPSSPEWPDCKPFVYFVCGVSELWVKAKSRNKSKDLIQPEYEGDDGVSCQGHPGEGLHKLQVQDRGCLYS